MVASTCAARGVVYWLGSQLYVQLTNRARGLSLVASRGPAFQMPASSGFAPLEAEPSVDTVVEAVLAAYANDERKRSLGQDVGRTCKRLVRAEALGRAVVAESAVAAPLLSSAMRMRMLAICELCAMCCDSTT